jgi:hypothetical protein
MVSQGHVTHVTSITLHPATFEGRCELRAARGRCELRAARGPDAMPGGADWEELGYRFEGVGPGVQEREIGCTSVRGRHGSMGTCGAMVLAHSTLIYPLLLYIYTDNFPR